MHPERLASVGIFVPSWLGDPSRTAYRYLQHYMQHPELWRYLKGGTLRSWGAKSLEESGNHGEPFLAGDGFARIGEGSGSTNVLTGSGVDEAWTTGTQLADAVIELLRAGKPSPRRISAPPTRRGAAQAGWSARREEAKNARNGFHHGLVPGMIGMALAGLTHGKLSLRGTIPSAHEQIRPFSPDDVAGVDPRKPSGWRRRAHRRTSAARCADDRARLAGDRFDGRLLVTQQDALLMGGKVQAMPGFADHVVFRDPKFAPSARRRPASPCARAGHYAGREGGSPSSARSACTAARACGTAPNASASTPISISAPAPADLHSAEN